MAAVGHHAHVCPPVEGRRRLRALLSCVGLAFLGCLAACGSEPAEPPTTAPPLDLPVVGTVGEPPPLAERRTIQVTRSGHIRLPGRDGVLSLEELRQVLTESSRVPGTLAPDGSSRWTALLEIDAGTPWLGVQWILQTCAHPAVRIWRLSFAAVTPDGEVGAIGVTLPSDRGPTPTPLAFPPYHRVKVFQRDEGPASGFGVLAERLAALPKDETGIGAVFDVVAPPPSGGRVPYGTILRVVDLTLQAGARFVSFEGAAMPYDDEVFTDADAFARHLASLREQGGAPRFKVDGLADWLPPDPENASAPRGRGRIPGRYGASFDDWPLLEEAVLEEVVEADEDADR